MAYRFLGVSGDVHVWAGTTRNHHKSSRRLSRHPDPQRRFTSRGLCRL